MSGEALIFSVGADLKALKADLKAADDLVINSSKALTGKLRSGHAAVHSSGHSGGHGLGRAELHGIGESAKSLAGIGGVGESLHLIEHSLPIAAVALLSEGIEKAREKYEELAKASEHAHEVLQKPMDVNLSVGGTGATSYIASLKKAEEDLREKRTGTNGILATIGAMFSQGLAKTRNAIGGNNAYDDRSPMVVAKEREEELGNRRVEAALKLKEITKEEAEERQQAFAMGGCELELVTARQKMEKDIAEIQANGQGVETNSTLIQDRRAQFAIEQQEIDRKADAQEREMDLQRAIMGIKMIGRDLAIEEAKARLAAANAEAKATQGRPEEHAAAGLKQEAAALALRDAQRQTDEHRAQLAIATAIADMRAPEEAKQLQKLKEESAELQRQLQTLGEKEDKRADIAAKIAENAAAQRAAQRSQDARAHGRADTLIDATTGTGDAERAKALARHLAEAQRYQARIANNPEVSQDEKAGAAAKVNQLKNQQEEMEHSRNKGLADAYSEVDVMREQLERHGEIAEALRTQHEYEDRINEARRNGNEGLARALEMQRQISQQQQIQNLQRQTMDPAKATLAELAANAMNQQGAAARHAMRLERHAEQERVRGHTDKAKQLQDQADKIKGGIGALKDSEKERGLQKEQLTQLEKIEKNTAKAGVVGP